tara:strand:- start:110 stop:397 length:288 start_codon:yes stop_codon:yes gene_type:complete
MKTKKRAATRKLKYTGISKQINLNGDDTLGKVVCRKRGFSTRKAAKARLKELQLKPGRHTNHRKETKVYKCPHCPNIYHLTSQSKERRKSFDESV